MNPRKPADPRIKSQTIKKDLMIKFKLTLILHNLKLVIQIWKLLNLISPNSKHHNKSDPLYYQRHHRFTNRLSIWIPSSSSLRTLMQVNHWVDPISDLIPTKSIRFQIKLVSTQPFLIRISPPLILSYLEGCSKNFRTNLIRTR